MRLFAALRSLGATLFRRSRVENELSEELATHLQNRADDLQGRGLSREEAERWARVEFGGQERFKEECREEMGASFFDTLEHDVKYGLRGLRKSPGFTAIAVMTLALGIGANTAIFSVVDAVLLRPLPYHEPERLLKIFESNEPNDFVSRNGVAPGNFLDWRERNRVFDQMGAVSLPGFNLTGTDHPVRVIAAAVSAGTLNMLGLQPLLGRDIEAQDDRDGAPGVVVLGYGLWQRQFGGDAGILGKAIHLGTVPYTVIGVLPKGLTFPDESAEMWVALEQDINTTNMHWRNSHYLDVYGRLKPGVTLQRARADLNRIAGDLKHENPDTNSGKAAYLTTLQDDLIGDVKPALLTLLVAVGFVLFIACANVANLSLVRATSREKEMSIRLALGAGRWRLTRQMLTESLLLSSAGGFAGLLIARWASATLLALRPESLPRYNAIAIDSRVLIFTVGISVLTGVLFGIIPALRGSKSDVNLASRGNSRGSTITGRVQVLRNVLVGSEIAISLVLLMGAGLLIRSFLLLRENNLGFRTGNIVTARVSIPEDKYPQDAQVARFYDDLLTRVRALPGVEGAGATSFLPLTGNNFDNSFDIVGRPERPRSDKSYALVRFVDPAYFHLMEIPLLRGRGFGEHDRLGAQRVIVVSQAMAKQFWGEESPIGQLVKVYMGIDQSPWEVVGVAGDVRTNIATAPQPMMYFPYDEMPYKWMVLTVRTRTDAKAMLEEIRTATQSIDPDQPISQTRTLDGLLAETLAPWRFSMALLTAFAGLALILAAAGIYGVISYTVGQRTSEIGIRMTLGAQPRDVLRMVVWKGLAVVAIGMAAGVASALFLTRFLTTQIYGVRPTDPLTFAVIAVLLGIVALCATYIPARRATHVDPVIALRYE
jgi:putative ABC transport system permease protein